jgi:hypothetical protein
MEDYFEKNSGGAAAPASGANGGQVEAHTSDDVDMIE